MKRFHSLTAGLWPANWIFARWFAFALIFLPVGLLLVQPCVGAPFQFEATGSLAQARQLHTATLLPNGSVLVTGGVVGGGPGSRESSQFPHSDTAT